MLSVCYECARYVLSVHMFLQGTPQGRSVCSLCLKAMKSCSTSQRYCLTHTEMNSKYVRVKLQNICVCVCLICACL